MNLFNCGTFLPMSQLVWNLLPASRINILYIYKIYTVKYVLFSIGYMTKIIIKSHFLYLYVGYVRVIFSPQIYININTKANLSQRNQAVPVSSSTHLTVLPVSLYCLKNESHSKNAKLNFGLDTCLKNTVRVSQRNTSDKPLIKSALRTTVPKAR